MSSEAGWWAHPTALVDEGAEIGVGTKVWHFSHVMTGAQIGAGCSLGQNVFVATGTTIGNNVKVQNNVSVYERVHIGDDVFCGPSMVFTNVINPRSHVSRKHEYLETHVGRGASLGANCTVLCGNDVGSFAFVAAGAVVSRNVPDYALVMGVPARVIGYMSAYGERLDLAPGDPACEVACPASGERYRWDGATLCPSAARPSAARPSSGPAPSPGSAPADGDSA